ncbi:hypothetical protein D3C78_1256700 [compost metagenome]
MLDQQGADLTTVELLLPGRAGVAAVQHHAIIAHRPALGGGRKIHGRKIGTGRHDGLLPMLAGVIGKQNVATLADGDHALTGAGHAGQRAVDGQGTDPGGQVQHIDVIGRLGDALRQAEHNAKRQLQNIIFIRTHAASSSENRAGAHIGVPDVQTLRRAGHVGASACGWLSEYRRRPGIPKTTGPWRAARCT